MQLLDLLRQGALRWFEPREKLKLLTPEANLSTYTSENRRGDCGDQRALHRRRGCFRAQSHEI